MPATSIRVILVRTQGPVNLGMCCRLTANLGIDDLVLVDPQCELDVKETRMFANKARGKLETMPVFANVTEATADCDLVIGTTARRRDADWGKTFVEVSAFNQILEKWPAKNIAILFGNEADGLNNDELSACHHYITLNTFSDYYSYNLSHAVAICLYQIKNDLAKAANETPAITPDEEADALANQEKRSRLFDYWLDSLDRVGYLPEHKEAWRRKHFQRLFQRMPLSDKDCDLMRGMLAQYEKRKFNPDSEGS